MGARMRLLAMALGILMMVSSCLATSREVLKADELIQHEDDSVVHGRQLLEEDGDDAGKEDGDNPKTTTNHHYIPRCKYPIGGVGDAGCRDGSE
ncbi:hypothetical protein PTKIN_Ptkin11bG0011600 [Pterospermum kingtungense]